MSGVSATDKAYLNKKLGAELDAVYLLKDDTGIDFHEAFHVLPPRSNSGYFKVIQRPMSYSKIRQAIKHQKYSYAQEFVTDVAQITWNARYFNMESSPYYRWATILDTYLRTVVIPSLRSNTRLYGHELIGYPDLGPLPGTEGDSVDKSIVDAPPAEVESAAAEAVAAIASAAAATSTMGTPTSLGSPVGAVGSPVGAVGDPVGDLVAAAAAVMPLNSPSPVPDFSTAAQPHPVQQQQQQQQQQHSNLPPPSGGYHHSSTRHPVLPNYNPSAYESHVEPNAHPNVYNPPRISNSGISNRQLLEQWVKRGRPPIVDKPHEQRIKSIMRGLKKVKVNGKTIIAVFDKLPNQQDHPEFYQMIKDPVSMLNIKGLIKQRYYQTVDAYMADVFRLINNGKKYYAAVHNDFSLHNIHLLETNIVELYQQEMQKPDSDYIGDLQSSKIPLSQVGFQGRSYKVGHWVMMKNPNDATRPIPSQIFRIWQEHGKQFVNVCWYYRPEWTTHRFDRLFLENEVFKTGQYRDHQVEDIVGPCYVAYFTRWLKGDPGVKYEGPLFICEFRYNDRELNFAKIRTWKACLPDEVRHIEDPIFPLDSPRVLKKFPSPIKHLLPPGSNPLTPVPPPTILNLNAPPLVGGIYVKRPGDEEEHSYFDEDLRQDQFKLLIPPALNTRGSTAGAEVRGLGHRGRSRSPSQPQYSPAKVQAMSYGLGQIRNGGLPPYAGQAVPTAAPAAASDVTSATAVPNAELNPYTLQQLQQRLQQQQQQQQQPVMQSQQQAVVVGSGAQPQQTPEFAGGEYPTHSYSGGGGHKVIHTPFNSTSYQFSNFSQASFSQTFLQPSSRERALAPFVKKSYEKADPANYQRFYKTLEKNNFMHLDAGESMVDPAKRQDGGADDDAADTDPMLWFKSPPQYIANRILNTGEAAEDEQSNELNPVAKKRKLAAGLKTIKLGHSAKYLVWKKSQEGQEQNVVV